MPSDLKKIPVLERDEAFAITADFTADQDPRKVSLGAGVYRDEKSKPWILPSVKAVCKPSRP
jgi:aspartate/tyrosine/aromatic aminotransferase